MPTFRSKPSEVEAVQWDGYNLGPLYDFLGEDPGAEVLQATGHGLEVLAGVGGAQGWVPVPNGHWVVRGGNPVHYWPVDPATFADRYEPAEVDA